MADSVQPARKPDSKRVISENDAQKLANLIQKSRIPEKDKKWWLTKVKRLNVRQAMQLWRIFHATKRGELNTIIKEEEEYQVKLKDQLNTLVKTGTARIYHVAEEEEHKVEEAGLEEMLKEEGINQD
jgi:hypothetical protein